MTTDPRSALSSDDRDYPPGPLAGIKRGPTSDPSYPQPQAAEVESARLLANDARQTLLAAGFSDQDIDRLADDFIAENRGEETGPPPQASPPIRMKPRRSVYARPATCCLGDDCHLLLSTVQSGPGRSG